MNPFEAIVLVVAMVVIGWLVRHRLEVTRRPPDTEAEAAVLREEVAHLKARLAVLERLATDERGTRALDDEIARLK